jgi:hypothetical protein
MGSAGVTAFRDRGERQPLLRRILIWAILPWNISGAARGPGDPPAGTPAGLSRPIGRTRSCRVRPADRRPLVGVEPLPRLCQALDIAGAHDAAFSVDRLMAVVARSVRQSIVIQCPRCPRMSDDEKSLLHAASLAQAGDAQCAEKALHTVLLSAQGAEFALGPLKGIGELFAAARLLFRRRSPPLTGDVISGIVEPWSPPESSGTVH